MTPTEKITYQRKWHAFQQRYEAMYIPRFKRALKEQVAAVVNRAGPTASIATWLASVNVVRSKPIEDVLDQLYKQVGPLWAQHTGVHRLPAVEKKGLMPMGFSDRIVQLMREIYGLDLFLDAVDITENTKEYIRQVLNHASESGWGYDEIVKQLGAKPELSTMRARRIARTEVVTSANGAAVANAKDSKIVMNKIWISVRDKRTRHSHVNEDNQQVGIDDVFIVGSEKAKMMQPGAPKEPDGTMVPLKERVNCRCTVAFIAKRDANGRLVKKPSN